MVNVREHDSFLYTSKWYLRVDTFKPLEFKFQWLQGGYFLFTKVRSDAALV